MKPFLQYSILLFTCCVFKLYASTACIIQDSQQVLDSLIHEKTIDHEMNQLELLVLYYNAMKSNPKDSIELFKKLAILNADLGQPEDAFIYTEKYINNTLDFDILQSPAYKGIKGSAEYEKIHDTYSTRLNFLVFLFFYVAIIGFSITITINFLKHAKTSAKFFISGFVAVHTLFVFEFVLHIANLRLKFPHFYRIASTVALWYGPLIYFYFKSLSARFKFRIVDLLHFLPNILLLIYLWPLYSMNASEKIKILLKLDYPQTINDKIIFITKIISLAIYAFLIGKLWYKNSKAQVNAEQTLIIINKWKRNIYSIHVLYIITYIIYCIAISGILGIYAKNVVAYTMVGIMSIMIFYIAYMSYVQPVIFTENIKYGGDIIIDKYQKSGLTSSLSEELKDDLLKLLNEEKVFKQNDISLDVLSAKLDTTRHNASQIINEHFDMNFFELINKFRIQEAIKILESDIHGNLNIIDIAYEIGYNNKATFNKAFKKETALTPTQFIQSRDKKSQVNLR